MDEMSVNGKAVYLIAVKVFLRDCDKLLLIHDVWNNWELPGGRIKPHEFRKPLDEVVERKIREELGGDLRYSGLKPTGTFFQVERVEETGENIRIFGIGFEAKYEGGDISMSSDHDELKWVNVNTFNPKELQDNDWMRGVDDYLESVRSRK